MDHKPSGGCYYLRLFFDLMDISVVNSHAIYNNLLDPKKMELLHSKVVLAKSLISTYNSCIRNTTAIHVSLREVLPTSVPLHLPVLQTTRVKCKQFYTWGIDTKIYIQCNTRGVFSAWSPAIVLETVLQILIPTCNRHFLCWYSLYQVCLLN